MKRYILKKQIFAFVFMVTVFGFAAINMMHTYEPIKEEVMDLSNVTEFNPSDMEDVISASLFGRMNFIEMYSFAQVLLDKREFNNFAMIKDEEGFLHYASFFREPDKNMFQYALRVKRLQDYVSKNGTEVLFVVTPSKYNKDDTTLREGMPINDPENTVNELLFHLNRLGIKTLNLGEVMPNENLAYEDTFFKTDHHWTVPAAFFAAQEVVDTMNQSFSANLDPDYYYRNINNYQKETYYGGMLGSMGRKTGAAFSGIDNFTALWPKYEGNFYRQSMTNDGKIEESSGTFTEVLMNPKTLYDDSDLYSGSQYALYLNELRIYERIINNDNLEGSKIFMIRDSYFSPLISFMMPMCGEIDAIWSLEESDKLDIETYVKNNKFDYIVIEVYPYNINDAAFNYFKEETNGKAEKS